jgi:hypothetical protein
MAASRLPATGNDARRGAPAPRQVSESMARAQATECNRNVPRTSLDAQRQQRNGLLSPRDVRGLPQPEPRSVGVSPTERIEPLNTCQSPPQVKQMLQAAAV